ncbi:hypothetical protein UF75_2006 [Desulfosporosinus sp. I2]|uniref:DUF5320 domain-containing protein n=1 Tax=Desulfosporosinus sp. I2 TaxID=1617025 RepID=UPI0005EEF922|nr:DUF5320 domain-containing protein [Desulfosporosinus sp. I2]KJR47580.1 hypothetical protein UF75_2006 [Desulfosporosinus sp. I2]
MPGRDGTGQMGRGSMTGRGFGFCKDSNPVGKGTDIGSGQGSGKGFGHRRYFGKGPQTDLTELKTQKELLQAEKEQLESKLKIISQQLQSI